MGHPALSDQISLIVFRNTPGIETTLCDLEDNKLRLRFETCTVQFRKCRYLQRRKQSGRDCQRKRYCFRLGSLCPSRQCLSAKPLEVVQLNFFDCLNVINACVKTKTRLIHFSTSEVYGKTAGSNEAFSEDNSDLILGPIKNQRWIYSCAKQLLDRMILCPRN